MNPFFAYGTWRMRRTFRKALSRSLVGRTAVPAPKWTEIESDYRDILRANAERAIDEPAMIHLCLAAFILATYRKLAPFFADRRDLLDVLTHAFGHAYRGTGFPAWIWLLLRVSRAPYDTLRRGFSGGGKFLYGKTFQFQTDERPDTFTLGVKRCLYNDFFRANGAVELTLVFCAADDLWSGLIDPRRHGVRFERPTTLALGGDMCRFEFHRSAGEPPNKALEPTPGNRPD